MEMIQGLMASIDYIENRLDQSLEIEDIAKVACLSKYHYQRMFHMLTGVTVAEYIRRRRLTLAVQDLLSGKEKVIEIALRYGYETPEAFSKAFRRAHGISPTEVRRTSKKLKAYPRLSFHIQIKGDCEMNYKLIDKEAFNVIGKGITVSLKDGENNRLIPLFWKESNQNGLTKALGETAGSMGLLGVCMPFDALEEQFTYLIAAEQTVDLERPDMETIEIPAATWAVFEAIGPMPQAIQNVWERIYSEWFPSTGYEQAAAPQLEVYLDGKVNDPNYRSEIWIPIIKK